MKNGESGITMVVLAITCIVLLILAGVTIYGGKKALKGVDLENIQTNLLLIQAKTKIKSENYAFDKKAEDLVGTALSQDIITKLGITDATNARMLSKEDLKNLGLTKIEENNTYVVDYKDNEIYYVVGYQAEDTKTYYKLSEIQQINRKEER